MKKVIKLLITLSLTTSCYAMDPPKEEFSKERFMPIFREVVRFHDFLNSPVPDMPTNTKLSQHSQAAFLQKCSESEKQQKNSSVKLLKAAELLISGQLHPDQFFQESLLHTRLLYLLERRKAALKTIQKTDLLVPTYPNLLNLMQQGLTPEEQLTNVYVMERSITLYQFFNTLCYKMFNIVQLDELHPDTIKLLRASPKLWPLLKGETRDLGHPDEAGGFSFVKAYLDDTAIKFYKRNIGLKPLERVELMINNNVISPLWEKEKLRNDAEIFNAHLRNYEGQTLYAFKKWPEDLPDPPFLRLKLEVELPPNMGPSFFDMFPFEKLDEEEEIEDEHSSAIHLTSQVLTSLREPEPSHKNAEKEPIQKENNAPYLSPPVVLIKEISSDAIKEEKPLEFIFPVGIRKFHDLMPATHYAMRSLNPADQDYVNTVFDKQMFTNVTFKSFKIFWEGMGGKIQSDHGGSHKLLIGPEGESLFGIYAHNNNQRYTKKTIKYLRAALWYIGCRPTK